MTELVSLFSQSWSLLAVVSILSVIVLQVVLGRNHENELRSSEQRKQSAIQVSSETRRRVQHALTGQALVGVSYVLPRTYCLVSLLVGALLILYIRLTHDGLYRRLFGALLRPAELHYGVLPGAFWFLLGTFFTALLFDLPIARYSVLCLSYADPVAAWIGMSLPSITLHAGTSLSGSLGCFVTAWIVGYVCLDPSVGIDTTTVTVGAVVCTITEALPSVNDNLLIPVLTAGAITWANQMGNNQ